MFITPLIIQVHAATPPELRMYYSPSPWVTPGSMVTLTTDVSNTDPEASLTDANVHFVIHTGNQYDPVFVSSDNGFTCARTDEGRYSTPQYDCSGGVIPPGGSATIVYQIQTPDVVYYANTYYGATSTIATYDLTSSDAVLIAPYYAPELVANIKADKSQMLLGDTVTYSAYVYNGGYLPSDPTTMLVTFPDGTSSSIDVPSLPAKEFSPTATFTFTPTLVGTNSASITVDPDNLVEEYSEDNNTAENSVIVSEMMPDLTISISSPLSVAARSTFTETATVTNQGNSSASNIVFEVPFSGTYRFGAVGNFVADHGFVCTKTIYRRFTQVFLTGYQCTGGTLAAGETATVKADITAPYYAGKYYTNGYVDPNHLVKESDETNNSTNWPIAVY